MKRIRSGDTVVVNTGKSKGHVGKVIRVLDDSIVVEGANLVKKHVKPNPQLNIKGGIESLEKPLHISNVALYDPATEKGSKIGFKFVDNDGIKTKVRYFKSTSQLVDQS